MINEEECGNVDYINDKEDDDGDACAHLSRPHVRSMAAPLAGSRNREEYWRNLIWWQITADFHRITRSQGT